jgi:transcriptional regulator with XRE-family HTH domain
MDIPGGPRPRDNTAMAYGEKIRELRKAAHLTQDALGQRVGVEQPTIQRWERNKREPSLSDIEKLANVFGIEMADFFKSDEPVALGPRLFVKGEVAAGVWKDAFEWPEDDWVSFTGRSDVTAELQHRFGLKIIGDSMDEVYPPGTIVECVTVFGRAEAAPGKRVVVLREREDHQFEATVKELVDIDGVLWARPRSTNPAHQSFKLDDGEEGILQIRVIAVVVASIRPE